MKKNKITKNEDYLILIGNVQDLPYSRDLGSLQFSLQEIRYILKEYAVTK